MKKIYSYTEIREEVVKCMLDTSRRYMIENYLSTFDATQKRSVQFKLLPRQEILVQALRDNDNVITIKSRQEGITTTVAAVMACEMVLAAKESPENILCIGNKLDLSQQMITKIKEFIRQLPRWFFGDEYFSLDPKNQKNNDKKTPIFTICNKDHIQLSHNLSEGHARSSGENSSRGISAVSRLIFDEAAFIEKGRTVYAQALPTISTGGKITIISTPNGKDQLYYDIYDKAKAGRNNFVIVESRWHQDPRYNKYLKWLKTNDDGELEIYNEPTIDAKGNVKYDNDKWMKLIADGWKPESPWYVNMCNSFNNDEMKIAQELDVSFLGSANNVVGAEYITFQELNNVCEPLFKDSLLDDFWIWKKPIEGHRYIIATDASRGDSDDRTAIEIIDMDGVDENGNPIIEQVAEYNGKRTGDEIGEILYEYGQRYNNALIVIDCIGGTGDAAILTLMRLKYNNLYYDDPNLKSYTVQRKFIEYNMSPEDRLPGFHSGQVRFQMLSNFASLVKNNGFKIRSARVISELDTWIFKGETGRMDHMDGKHDDTLTCLAMGLFVMQFSYNRIECTKSKDRAVLSAWVVNVGTKPISRPTLDNKTVSIAPTKNKMIPPFYSDKTLKKQTDSIIEANRVTNLWLFGAVLR